MIAGGSGITPMWQVMQAIECVPSLSFCLFAELD